MIVGVNQEITEELAAAIQAAGIERVKIRSVLTCESKRGVCQLCYGRNLATGRMVERGEAVGVIAAQSIGEPGTQLTMRTFHIGGTATRVCEQSKQDAKSDGFAKYINIQRVLNKQGRADRDEPQWHFGRWWTTRAVRKNATRSFMAPNPRRGRRQVKANEILLEWDPYTFSILTEVSGMVHFKDLQRRHYARRSRWTKSPACRSGSSPTRPMRSACRR